jgi:gluconolactonase
MSDWKDRSWDGGPVRYPDPAIEPLDERFGKYHIGNAAVERLFTGIRWGEGPVWFGDARCLLFSDIPNNRIMRWNESDGSMSVFRQPSNYCNGHTRDRQGRLITCEHGTRSVTRTEYDGSITVLIDSFDGKPLNAPNDVVVHSDNSIWFTDPGYGIMLDYEGHVAEYELPQNVYRLDPETGKATVVVDDFIRPNGLCFSPDEKTLYISDTGASHGLGGPAHIRAFDVDDGTLKNGRIFVDMAPGFADGIRCDVDGNVWSSSGWGNAEDDGVKVFAPDGDLIGQIHLPEPCSNLCFGGQKKNRLFMTCGMSLYSVFVEAKGAQTP